MDYNIPEHILETPDKYDKIYNKHGVCGKKPNLYYNDTVHRIWVSHAYKSIVEGERTIESYVNDLCHKKDNKEEMKESVKQAIRFYLEYEKDFEEINKYREEMLSNYRS